MLQQIKNISGDVIYECDIAANSVDVNRRGFEEFQVALEQAVQEGVSLSGADLRGAWLLHAKLQGANLVGANFRGSMLVSPDLRDAKIGAGDMTIENIISLRCESGSGPYVNGHELIGDNPIFSVSGLFYGHYALYGYRTDKGLLLKIDGFFGSVESFLSKYCWMGKDNHHREEYLAALNLIKIKLRIL